MKSGASNSNEKASNLSRNKHTKNMIEVRHDSKLSDPMSALPAEITTHIMSFLPLASLASAQRVSQNWKTISDTDFIWKKKAKENGMSEITYEVQESLTSKENLRNFVTERKEIENFYPKKLIEIFGGAHNIAKFPVFDVTQLIPCLKTEIYEMKQGETINCNSVLFFKGSDFRGMRIYAKTNAEPNLPLQVQDFEFFKDQNIINLYPINYSIFSSLNSIEEDGYEYLGRLLRHEPCGFLRQYSYFGNHVIQEGVRTLSDGRSIIELTDPGEVDDKAEQEEAMIISQDMTDSKKKKFGSSTI